MSRTDATIDQIIRSRTMIRLKHAIVALILIVPTPVRTLACACGCNAFMVGARWTMPMRTGFDAFLQYSYMDQRTNWSG